MHECEGLRLRVFQSFLVGLLKKGKELRIVPRVSTNREGANIDFFLGDNPDHPGTFRTDKNDSFELWSIYGRGKGILLSLLHGFFSAYQRRARRRLGACLVKKSCFLQVGQEMSTWKAIRVARGQAFLARSAIAW
jgi:hypothetical protein